MLYKTAPFRIWDRTKMYEQLKLRLLNNLVLAKKVCLRDCFAIIKRYSSITAFFKMQERKYMDILDKNRSDLQVNINKQGEIRPSIGPFDPAVSGANSKNNTPSK